MRILLLGGTTEGSALARALDTIPGFETMLSLAGITRSPHRPARAMRIGGFGGVAGLAAYLCETGTDVLVDATHPFARQIGHNAVQAASQAGVPLLRIARPPWLPVPGDRWTVVSGIDAAAAALGSVPRRILLTIGRKELAPFARHPLHHYVVRSVDPPPANLLPPHCTVLTARGPFTLDGERALLVQHAIDLLVTKNSGGAATRAKLDAARDRGLPVIMIAQPARITTEAVPDWQSALSWLQKRHQSAATPRAV